MDFQDFIAYLTRLLGRGESIWYMAARIARDIERMKIDEPVRMIVEADKITLAYYDVYMHHTFVIHETGIEVSNGFRSYLFN